MEEMEFQCDHCDVMFVAPLFPINQTREKLVIAEDDSFAEMDVKFAEGIANFCSVACRQAGREKVLAAHGLSVPAERPGLDSDDSFECSICSSPVDITAEHMTFSEEEIDLTADEPTPVDFEYLALVCPKCESNIKVGRVRGT